MALVWTYLVATAKKKTKSLPVRGNHNDFCTARYAPGRNFLSTSPGSITLSGGQQKSGQRKVPRNFWSMLQWMISYTFSKARFPVILIANRYLRAPANGRHDQMDVEQNYISPA